MLSWVNRQPKFQTLCRSLDTVKGINNLVSISWYTMHYFKSLALLCFGYSLLCNHACLHCLNHTRWWQWRHHFIMLQHLHVETGSKQTYQSMNWPMAQVIHVLVCVLPMRKIWHFSGKFDKHLSLYWRGSVKLKLQTGSGCRFLWESC